jgi:transglutaminase-like putative cysteine protease
LKSSWRYRYVAQAARPRDLVRLPATYPAAIADRDLTLLEEGVRFPPFGQAGREQEVEDLLNQHFFDRALVRWKDVYASAWQLTRDAKTPYEAVLAVEDFFQTEYRYSEKANFAGAAAGPLPTFFLSKTRVGYCQMYSGTMAVMLRLLGIPARVAEGFTPGKYDSSRGAFAVTDRDAHAWVEVWFPRYGWLPFEPTPSRTLPVDYSSTSPTFAKGAQEAVKAQGSKATAALLERLARLEGTPSNRAGRGSNFREVGAEGGSVPAVDKPWRPGFLSALGLIAVGLVVLLQVLKRVRRLRKYLRRDVHGMAAAVRGDLEDYVVDQGLTGDVGALTPDEFSRMLHREFGVDAKRWAALQARARYGRLDLRAHDAVRDALREARQVRRALRKTVSAGDRLRGALRVRSLLR